MRTFKVSTTKINEPFMMISPNELLAQFAEDVKQGLGSQQKYLSSKYFYDDEGSRLFQRIMHLPEYYLTNCEQEIFETYWQELLEDFGVHHGEFFELIELGAGDGLKTKYLLKHFVEQHANFEYLPVDISSGVLATLEQSLKKEVPELSFRTLQNDYFRALQALKNDHTCHRALLFLGSNIGNFSPQQALNFLKEVRQNLNNGDQLLLGCDLRKSPEIILSAYNDSAGVTRDFNLNLLTRINRELGGNFDLSKFIHAPIYHPQEGAAKSYLVSTETQTVRVDALEQQFVFDAWEAIYTESSYKYTFAQLEYFAQKSGFKVSRHFSDKRQYFTNTLWEAA